jgi:hypothetical protein
MCKALDAIPTSIKKEKKEKRESGIDRTDNKLSRLLSAENITTKCSILTWLFHSV